MYDGAHCVPVESSATCIDTAGRVPGPVQAAVGTMTVVIASSGWFCESSVRYDSCHARTGTLSRIATGRAATTSPE